MLYFLQIRDELPELKAIVQYKGELSQEYPNVYDVRAYLSMNNYMYYNCYKQESKVN